MSDNISQKYDVFISFRGEDTRVGFTSHLHEALCHAKIETCIDYGLDKGDEISSALLKAIEESKISIIIFSENYANSGWCLGELMHILECRRTKKQLVVPVFYRVDPSNVRKQEESYGIALNALKERFSDDKILEWRTALTTAANLVGWSSSAISPDSALINGITQDILRKLKRIPCTEDYQGQLVGIGTHIENIESLLGIGSAKVIKIGIWGMGGMGKTTLSSVVFNRLSYQFEARCFLGKIGENWENGRKYGYFRSRLLSALLEENGQQNTDTLLLASFDKDKLQHKKVLIVLDDVNGLEQLDTLIGDCSFGPESRIIVTTRDKQLLKNHVDHVYQVTELAYDEALRLFHLSLKGIAPPTHLAEVVDKVVYYSGRIPMTVKFLAFLFGSKDMEYWERELEKLKKLLPGQIQDFLSTSYNQLDEKQRTIFLDIACFFKGNDRDYVETLLDGCDLCASTGIVDLIDKCLVTTIDKQLTMSDLVQNMGWEIVRKQSIEEPGKRSRLWLAQDVYHVLKHNTGTEAVEGIFLNMSEIGNVIVGPTAFQNMYNLRLLKFYNLNVESDCKVCLPKGLNSLPDKLIYLHWDQYPLKTLPSDFIAVNLVELVMCNSQVEKLWSGVQHLNNLRKIDLSHSKYLIEVPDVSKALNLELVYLKYCTRLREVPSYFQNLEKLDTLMLEGCSSLEKLPKLPQNIRRLVLDKTAIEKLPSSIGFVSKLEILCLRDCPRLVSLPISICKLKSLSSLCLSGCSKLETFPEILEPMEHLTILELDGTRIKDFPFSVRNLVGIKPLNMNILEKPKLIPRDMCKLETANCLYLHQLRSKVPSSDHPGYHLHEKVCKTVMEILSISTSALVQGWSDFQLCGRKYLLYNCLELEGRAHNIGVVDHEDAESFHKELRRSKFKRRICADNDFGIFYMGNIIPNWFCHQSEGSFIRVKMDKNSSSALLGFAVCAVVDFTKNYPDRQNIRLLCQPHYILSDGQKLSWDFYSDNNSDETPGLLSCFRKSPVYFPPNGEVHEILSFQLIEITEALFEFCCVDEKYEPLEGCIVERCGVQLLFATENFPANVEDNFTLHSVEKRFIKGESESCSSEYEFDDTEIMEENEEEEQRGRTPLEVASISSRTLKQCCNNDFHYQNFQLHNFLELHTRARNGITNPKVKVLGREIFLSEFKRELLTPEDNGACCVGSEMNPNWFSYQCKGSSIDVKLPPNWLSTNFLGFVVCAIISTKDSSFHDYQCLKLLCRWHFNCDFSYLFSCDFRGHHGCIADYEPYNGTHNLDHNFGWKNKKRKRKRGRNWFTNGENVVMASFNFWCVDENNEPLEGCEVIKCGLQLLYAEELDLISDQNSIKSREEVDIYEYFFSQFQPRGSEDRMFDVDLKGKEPSEEIDLINDQKSFKSSSLSSEEREEEDDDDEEDEEENKELDLISGQNSFTSEEEDIYTLEKNKREEVDLIIDQNSEEEEEEEEKEDIFIDQNSEEEEEEEEKEDIYALANEEKINRRIRLLCEKLREFEPKRSGNRTVDFELNGNGDGEPTEELDLISDQNSSQDEEGEYIYNLANKEKITGRMLFSHENIREFELRRNGNGTVDFQLKGNRDCRESVASLGFKYNFVRDGTARKKLLNSPTTANKGEEESEEDDDDVESVESSIESRKVDGFMTDEEDNEFSEHLRVQNNYREVEKLQQATADEVFLRDVLSEINIHFDAKEVKPCNVFLLFLFVASGFFLVLRLKGF